MALDLESFVFRFPEFQDVAEVEQGEAAIGQALSDAAHFCSERIWGSRYEAGVMYKAAHLLSMSPWGEHARLEAQDSTVYGVVFDEMKRSLPIRMLAVRKVY